MDRVEIVHQNFIARLNKGDFPGAGTQLGLVQCGLTGPDLLALFRSQVISRQMDRVSRKMQASGKGYYTIGSSGHEGMAAIAAALKVSDPAFLHYRDAAFQIQRGKMAGEKTQIRDLVFSFATARDDPISGGRHKVLGSKSLNIPPQTSTIASHLPKAVGAAYSVKLARRIKPEHQSYADDAIILCSFGDASLNHSSAQGTINTAGWTAYQNIAMPILFVCEDNGIGISTKTPDGWIEASMKNRAGIIYKKCNGLDLLDTFVAAQYCAEIVRTQKKPVFLHMKTVRLYGHAGADAQQAYMSRAQIEADEADDPLLHSARILVEHGVCDSNGVLKIYNEIGQACEQMAEQFADTKRLETADDVMASLIPPKRKCKPVKTASKALRTKIFDDSDLRAMQTPQHMAKLINWALCDLMLAHDEIILAGEDIGPKGGVYGVTQKLHARFGAQRVINTLLDEQSILGLAIGMAQNGLLPVPEIQFLAYLHNAEDQLRGEAASLSFFSNGQFTNPMVVRIAGLGYQRGFGGHFHNDNSLAVLRDIPGIIVACPSNGHDAVLMLRECVRLAREEQRVVVFIEPIALYMMRDLHVPEDGRWCFEYPAPGIDEKITLGQIGEYGQGKDVAIISYGNGLYLSRQAEKILADDHNIGVKIIDLRWLAPLPEKQLVKALKGFERILIVDECRQTGSQSEALLSFLHEELSGKIKLSRLAARDSFIATGPAYAVTLPSKDDIIAAARKLCR